MSFSEQLKNFDWRSLQKYTDPQAAEKLNDFLEDIPNNTGQTLLIIAAVVWSAVAAAGLFTTIHLGTLTEMRAELQEAKALQPNVPKIENVTVSNDVIQDFAEKTRKIYRDLDITTAGSKITIAAGTTALFGQFREAIGHVQNGGDGWRVSIDTLCVGRECTGKPLSATLNINKVTVSN